MEETYKFPALFTRNSRNSPYCTITNGRYRITDTPLENSSYGYTIIEEALDNIIDRTRSLVKQDYCIEIPWRKKLLKIKAGTPVKIVEVKASQIIFTKREGDEVSVNDVIAHTVTGKSESRTVKSIFNGVIVFIGVHSFSNPETYVVAVADSGSIEWYERG